MDQQHADFLDGYTALFMKLVFIIILVYLLVLGLNFLRDKFINKEVTKKKDDISSLLIILNKLFFISGFGFVLANLLQVLFSQIPSRNHMPPVNFRGEWECLTFGVIIIFIGIGFKIANKMLKKSQAE